MPCLPPHHCPPSVLPVLLRPITSILTTAHPASLVPHILYLTRSVAYRFSSRWGEGQDLKPVTDQVSTGPPFAGEGQYLKPATDNQKNLVTFLTGSSLQEVMGLDGM